MTKNREFPNKSKQATKKKVDKSSPYYFGFELDKKLFPSMVKKNGN